ncbi:MAG: DUF1549 domain-containing protein, partial [Blastocatellia bacterium]
MLRTKSFIRCLFILAFTVIAWRVYNHDVRAQQAPAGVDFARDIAPILRQNCLGCHGPQKQMAGLRLDDKKTALAKVIIPGKAADSELYRRVAGLSDQARMPMKGQPLGASQISAIKRWIDEGAAWPDGETGGQGDGEKRKHWAFVAPVRPALPVVADKAWVRNPVDAFVLARLEKENLKPAPAADKITLLRRLSFDLTGLPPTPEEVDAFLADKSSRAYEKQVDRLLASPHYGERQARHWLDAARYADSDGFEKDKSRFVWFYRDWVINAFNQDKPYNQFIIEQIAGDLLPNATQDQRVATGFLRNSMNNEEGGIDPEQFRMEAMFDRMDAIGKSVLGLTIQCAQCHNHKFDPLKQEEYYRLFAFLNNSHESNLAVYTPEEQMKRAEILRRTQEIEAGLKHKTPDWPSRMQQWEQDIQRNHPEWTPEWKVIQPIVEDISTGGMRIIPQPDGSFVAGGYSPVKARPKFILKTEARNITAFRLELLTDPNLPRNGPGRSNSGSCALTEFELQTAPVSAPDKVTKHKFASATADISPPEKELDKMFDDKGKAKRVTGPVEFAIDGKEETAWTIDNGPGRRNASRKAVFNLATPAGEEGGTILTIHLRQHHGGWNNNDHQQQNIGRFRLSMTTAPNATADPLPAAVREILPIPHAQRTPAQTQTVFQYWRTTVPEFTADNQQIDSLWNQHPAGALQLVLNERSEMRDTHLLKRGDFLRPDKTVTANVPAFLHALPANAPGNRLTFAQWLTDRNSPTTARTFVNRVWQQYFGTGIVATSEDFG